MSGGEGERLQKVLSRAGIASRRAAEELIAAGRVTVNGEVAELGRRVDPEQDRIEVDAVPVPARAGLVYYLLNKPPGVISTAADTHDRPTVVDLVPNDPPVVPAGRLDADSEGLLLLTNDGDLIYTLTHPSRGVEKAYLVEMTGVPSRAALRALREGVDLDDGRTAPAKVSLLQTRGDHAAVEIVIHEGRKRQVRRMCAAVGHPVRRLVRVRIGPVADAGLGPGEWRPLTLREVRALYEAGAGGRSGAEPEQGGD